MNAELPAVALLNERFFTDYPREAARVLETQPLDVATATLHARSPLARQRAWQALSSDRAADVLESLPADVAQQLLADAEPQAAVGALLQLPAPKREALLAALSPEVAADLRTAMQHGPGTAGHLMDPRVGMLAEELTVAEAIERLRSLRQRGLRELYVVDDQQQLAGMVEVEDLALSGRERVIRDLARPVAAVVRAADAIADVEQAMRRHPLSALPVVDGAGRLLGVIRPSSLQSHAQRAGGRRWFR